MTAPDQAPLPASDNLAQPSPAQRPRRASLSRSLAAARAKALKATKPDGPPRQPSATPAARRSKGGSPTAAAAALPVPRIVPDDALATLTAWFASRGWQPFGFQTQAWQHYLAGQSGLIHAATGTGKTLAAWLGPVAAWLADHGDLASWSSTPPPLQVLWLTPMRALAADTVKALREPLTDLRLPWTVDARTGDTSSSARARQRDRLPTALVTTPESLCLLLSHPDSPQRLADLRCVIIDEWHELLATKRGSQTELALARLRRLRPDLRIWGLSATLGNLDTALAALVGNGQAAHQTARLVRGLVPKALEVRTLLPPVVERFPWAGHLRSPLLGAVVECLGHARSSLVFANTRSQAELWYQMILDARPDWAGLMALHHGSLDRKVRAFVEDGLKQGRLRCVICTSSLDLGVDFAPVETVIQIGSPKGIARLIQRAGRSGHQPGAVSAVICVPTNSLEIIDLAAARDALSAVLAGHGDLEGRDPLDKPLDVLAQHVVTIATGTGFTADELLAEVRTAWSYRHLTTHEWDWVLDFAVRGGDALRAYPEHHRIRRDDTGRYLIRDQATARRHRMAIGTITSETAMTVAFVRGGRLGTVEEGFISRLRVGDHFVFAGRVLRLVRVADTTAYVRKSSATTGALPSWQGSRMPLSTELAAAVRRRLAQARAGIFEGPEMAAAREVLALQARWSALPDDDQTLVETLHTREGHHLLIYPVEGRLVHEGLAALLALRLSRIHPLSLTMSANDYGFELLCDQPLPADLADPAIWAMLFDATHLLDDIAAGVNIGELSRRQFRDIARVAGLIHTAQPGARAAKSAKYIQASAALFYETFCTYDPGNLLLHQARREVLDAQLQASRLARVLDRLRLSRPLVCRLDQPGPFAFPLMVDRLRNRLSSESLADRVRRMQLSLERAADRTKNHL